ncbi:MAG TPA: DUF1775 domain-containing protein [Candidatus Paceibacterota bacterium]|nr:DUF1775 domain-containing protein [Candidatus Paceibacterota bacterium]
MERKFIIGGIVAVTFAFAGAHQASAHVIVTPSSIGIGTDDVPFTAGVPNEKNIPVIGLKLLIPSGLADVVPNVKPGWTIAVKKNGDQVTEIDWAGGSIPVGERDQFTFSAQVPADPATLDWKAYQTYKDGSVVSWDEDPNDLTATNPYSETQVIDDLAQTQPSWFAENGIALSFALSILAVIISAYALRKAAANKRL